MYRQALLAAADASVRHAGRSIYMKVGRRGRGEGGGRRKVFLDTLTHTRHTPSHTPTYRAHTHYFTHTHTDTHTDTHTHTHTQTHTHTYIAEMQTHIDGRRLSGLSWEARNVVFAGCFISHGSVFYILFYVIYNICNVYIVRMNVCIMYYNLFNKISCIHVLNFLSKPINIVW